MNDYSPPQADYRTRLTDCFGIYFKWIASDIPRGSTTELASGYNKKIFLALRFPAVLPEGVYNFFERIQWMTTN
jgi:hypothetical protein